MSDNKTWYISGHSQTPSDEDRALFTTVNVVYLNVIVAALGIGSNIINILVFISQGFHDNVNISLFALAVADLGSLVFVLIFCICSNPAFAEAVRPMEALDFQLLFAALPRGTLGRVTSCITAFITFERCLCVVLPFQVKSLITPRVTVAVMLGIFVCFGLTLIPFYLVFNFGWRHDLFHNTTVLGNLLTGYDGPADTFVSFSIHTLVQIISFIATIVFTIVIIVEIQRRSKWRKATAVTNVKTARTSKRKTTKTTVMIATMATVYIVCYTPSIAVLAASQLLPGFDTNGYFQNAFYVTASFNFLLESLNSSVGLILYYSTSVKFRTTFQMRFLSSRV